MARNVIDTERVVVICDGCGREFPSRTPENTDDSDVDKAAHRPRGWKADGGFEFCPACKEAHQEASE